MKRKSTRTSEHDDKLSHLNPLRVWSQDDYLFSCLEGAWRMIAFDMAAAANESLALTTQGLGLVIQIVHKNRNQFIYDTSYDEDRDLMPVFRKCIYIHWAQAISQDIIIFLYLAEIFHILTASTRAFEHLIRRVVVDLSVVCYGLAQYIGASFGFLAHGLRSPFHLLDYTHHLFTEF